MVLHPPTRNGLELKSSAHRVRLRTDDWRPSLTQDSKTPSFEVRFADRSAVCVRLCLWPNAGKYKKQVAAQEAQADEAMAQKLLTAQKAQ